MHLFHGFGDLGFQSFGLVRCHRGCDGDNWGEMGKGVRRWGGHPEGSRTLVLPVVVVGRGVWMGCDGSRPQVMAKGAARHG